MKHFTRLIALLLCFAMITGMAACGQPPAEPIATTPTQTPTEAPTEAPTEPPADLVYQEAAAKLDALSDVTLECVITTQTTVADQVFSEQSQQTLSYCGIGTDTLSVSLTEKLLYNVHEDAGETSSEIVYSEVYADGTLYTQLHLDAEAYHFSASVSPEDAASRYLPAVILDAALYSSITSEPSEAGTTVTFAQPVSGENWALPDGAEMQDAAGSAIVDGDGNLQQMNYNITYLYGPTEVRLEAEVKPLQAAEAIVLPESTDSYLSLQDANVPRIYLYALGMLGQTKSVTTTGTESITSQAAGVLRNQSVTMNMHRVEDLIAKIETDIYLMDYTTNQDQKLKQEEIYRGGKYVLTVDEGIPTTQPGIDPEVISEYCGSIMLSHLSAPDFWQDVTITDLGSVLFLEFTFNSDCGDTFQNSICSIFWEDPAFLNKLASAYVTNEVNGYISVDKFTGIPTAAGYYYKGTHTIEGYDYELTLQTDQTIEAPGLNAYYGITEELLPEKEPEEKATPLFYHVTGEAGQEMWLFGTIHIGDERTAYLPQEIYDAFAASDALALEFYSEAFEEKMEKDEKFQDKISKLYFYSNGSTTKDHLDEELYEEAVKYLKASGGYSMNAPYMKPSLWSQTIENLYLRQTYRLTSEKGCESRLEKMAEDQQKEIRDVESGFDQIKMSTGWSDDLQELILAEAIGYEPLEFQTSTVELYEMWCAGDESALRDAISDEVDTSELTEEELTEYEAQKHLLEEYNTGMSYDRNKGMLKVAKKYLESGDVVFFAVGLAHLLNNVNGLVDTLRAAGYTVELVSYS